MSLSVTSNNLILENSYKEDSIKELSKYNGLERSLFSEALDFSTSIKDEIRSNSRDFYFALKEAENEKERSNAFSKFNDILTNIIKKFINFLSKTIEKFIAKLSLIFKSDKYINDGKKFLKHFSKEEGDEFQYECYNYTHIDDTNFPKSKPIYDMEDYIKDIRSKLDGSESTGDSDSTALSTHVVKGYSNMDDDHFYDKFRYKLISENDSEGTISAENFKEELFNVFRDGGSKTKITVTRDFIEKTYKRFAEYKKLVDTVKTLRNETETTYRKLKSSLEKLLEVNNDNVLSYSYNDPSNERIKAGSAKQHRLELLIKSCVDKVTNMTTIHSLAFSAKLDAMIECYKEDGKIITEAIRRVKTRFNENFINEYYIGSLDNLELNEDCLLEGIVDYNTRSKLMEQFDRICDSSDYAMFLISEANKQDFMLEYINNEILSESDIKFSIINEAKDGNGIGSKIKNTINRILKFIAKLWGKFMEFFSKVFQDDKKYLEKYKDIILKKPFKEAEFEMFDYDKTGAVRAITDTMIPRFQYDQLKTLSGEKTEMEQRYLEREPYNKFIDDGSKSISENFIEHYSGKMEKINSQSLNRTNIFNYIYSYNEMISKLKQELSNFQKEADAAENFAKTYGGTKVENATVSEKDKLDKLLEDYFGEDVTINSGDKSNTETPDQSKSAGNNTSTTSDETEEQNTERTTTNQNSMETDSSQNEEIVARVEIYFKAAKDLIQGKMNLARRIYNDYFKIIQWHVRQYTGDKDEMKKEVKPDEGEDFSLKDAIN